MSHLQVFCCGLQSFIPPLKYWSSNAVYFSIFFLYDWACHAVLKHVPGLGDFPSSVAAMLITFVALMALKSIRPSWAHSLVSLVEPHAAFALRYMNVMFVPSCLGLVNSRGTGSEIGKTIVVFVVGYIVIFITSTVIVRCIRYTFDMISRKTHTDRSLSSRNEECVVEIHKTDGNSTLCEKTSEDTTIVESTRSSLSLPLADTCLKSATVSLPDVYLRICHWVSDHLDIVLILSIFILSTTIYVALSPASPAMPGIRLSCHLSMTLFFYWCSNRIPARARVVLHPLIPTTGLTIGGLVCLESIKSGNLATGFAHYITSNTLLSLASTDKVPGWPGAGDILNSAMPVAIISLAFNVFRCRPSRIQEWLVIFFSTLPILFLVMLLLPLFAHSLGISPSLSLAFSTRSVTAAIGIAVSKLLASNPSVVTCIIVATGISGPLLGPGLLWLARVKKDDRLTIGIVMGCNSHGIATAYLLDHNRPASAISSLSFALFGTEAVLLASIPAASTLIRSLAGY